MSNIRTYQVAGFHFTVEGCPLPEPENLKPFVSAPAPHPLFRLHVTESLPETPAEPFFITDDGPGFPEIQIERIPDGYQFSIRPLPQRPHAARLHTKADFTEGWLQLLNTDNHFALNNALMLMYAFASAPHGALEMHASVVMNEEKGYLFLGKSGTGKSTHSKMWLQSIPGTELLNDDNPILRLMPDGSARVFGSPWSGKTPCYKAKDVPAAAVVRIRQAPFNRIERLPMIQAYASLMASASSFRPFKGAMADGWHSTLEGLVRTVPCFTLDCLPNTDAAAVCYQGVHE